MPVQPANEAVRGVVAQILGLFVGDNEQYNGLLGDVFSEACEKFRFGPVTESTLESLVIEPSDVKLRDENLFLFLEPTQSRKMLPFVTLHSCCDWVHFRAYTLLATVDDNRDFQTLAIRFETDEGDPNPEAQPGSHDFCHAQLCNRINKHISKAASVWVPDSQPSIPLDADNQISLVLCVLVSIYGKRHVSTRVAESGREDLLRHLEAVRALRRLGTS